MRCMTKDQVLTLLRQDIAKAGSQKAWAAQAGVSQQYLSDMLRGARELSDDVLRSVGVERVVTYRRAAARRLKGV